MRAIAACVTGRLLSEKARGLIAQAFAEVGVKVCGEETFVMEVRNGEVFFDSTPPRIRREELVELKQTLRAQLSGERLPNTIIVQCRR